MRDLSKQLPGNNGGTIEVMLLAITYQKFKSSQSLEMKRIINYAKSSLEEGWECVASRSGDAASRDAASVSGDARE